MHFAIALLGTVGIVAMESSYVPQLVRLFRIKHAEEVSLLLPGLSLGGRLCATAFAYSQGQSVFVAGFLVGILLRGGLLLQVGYYRARLRRQRLLAQQSAAALALNGARAVPAVRTPLSGQPLARVLP